jgi:hypothetical protein
MSHPTRNPPSAVRLSFRTLAVGSLLLGIGSLTTLIIVVSVEGKDALSTVALALAILAFVIQIVVYIVQAADTSSQSRRAQELHAELLSILSELRERTSGTQRSVDSMNVRLLEAVIGKAQGDGLAVNTAEFAARLSNSLAEVAEEAPESAATPLRSKGASRSFPGPLEPRVAAALAQEMRTWPEADELPRIDAVMNELDDDALMDIYRHAADVERTSQPGAPFGPGLMEPEQLVVDRGLAEKIPGWKLYTLTPSGRLVGRIFTADPPIPSAFSHLAERREKVIRAHKEALDRALDSRDLAE